MTRKKPLTPRKIVITIVLVLWLLAFFFAGPWLAGWLFGTEAPTKDQRDVAKVLIIAPIIVPFFLILLWGKWNERRAIRASARTAFYGAKLVDPLRERRLDIDRD